MFSFARILSFAFKFILLLRQRTFTFEITFSNTKSFIISFCVFFVYNMKFPEKLWSMVNDCTSGAIGWGTDGKTIFVDYIKFENEFLGEKSGVFKTKNVVSFIRQLNLYGFRKCSRYNDIHEFKNQYFIRGRRDLLKLMRRKLGYALDIALPHNATKSRKSKITEEKENCIYDNFKRNAKISSPSDSFTQASYPFSPQQDMNSLPYGWWGNPYFPMHSIYPMKNPLANENCNSGEIKVENDDIASQKDFSSFWNNLDMYRNIIFVPVPAHQFGMYPGLYNDNLSLPSQMLHYDENKSSTASQE